MSTSEAGGAGGGRQVPFPGSLCHRCRHCRMVWTARSGFVLCQAPDLPKYPPQPVTACPGFAPRGGGGPRSAPGDGDG